MMYSYMNSFISYLLFVIQEFGAHMLMKDEEISGLKEKYSKLQKEKELLENALAAHAQAATNVTVTALHDSVRPSDRIPPPLPAAAIPTQDMEVELLVRKTLQAIHSAPSKSPRKESKARDSSEDGSSDKEVCHFCTII
jgi:hypothetical protein